MIHQVDKVDHQIVEEEVYRHLIVDRVEGLPVEVGEADLHMMIKQAYRHKEVVVVLLVVEVVDLLWRVEQVDLQVVAGEVGLQVGAEEANLLVELEQVSLLQEVKGVYLPLTVE